MLEGMLLSQRAETSQWGHPCIRLSQHPNPKVFMSRSYKDLLIDLPGTGVSQIAPLCTDPSWTLGELKGTESRDSVIHPVGVVMLAALFEAGLGVPS